MLAARALSWVCVVIAQISVVPYHRSGRRVLQDERLSSSVEWHSAVHHTASRERKRGWRL